MVRAGFSGTVCGCLGGVRESLDAGQAGARARSIYIKEVAVGVDGRAGACVSPLYKDTAGAVCSELAMWRGRALLQVGLRGGDSEAHDRAPRGTTGAVRGCRDAMTWAR